MFDLIIRNGVLIDGSGEPRRAADVGIRDGRIAAIGSVNGPATREIEAGGRIVAPGFVDPHTHYDAQAFWDPMLTPSSLHGVTTVIGGNCGFSIAPAPPDTRDYLRRLLARVEGIPLDALEGGVPWNWNGTDDYLSMLVGRLAINAGFMVGHSALRRAVMGSDATRRAARTEEVSAMCALLRNGLKAGGLGFSSSQAETHQDGAGDPVPSRFADASELIALAGVCSEFEGTSLEFIPTIKPFQESHAELMTSMSLAAGRPLNWNALHPNAANLDACLGQLAASDFARARGGKIVALSSPKGRDLRMCFATGFLLDSVNGWRDLIALPHSARRAALADPVERRRLESIADGGITGWIDQWGSHVIVETFSEETRRFVGRSVQSIADELGKRPFDALIDIVVTDDLLTAFQPPAKTLSRADWEARLRIWRDDRVVIGASDAGAHIDIIDTFNYPTTFLGTAVREQRLLPLEEAVALITSVPANLFGLFARGRISEGFCADLVIFDEATIDSRPTVTRADLPGGARRLYSEAVGIDHVLVNGKPILSHGVPTGATPGSILRSGVDTRNPSMQ